MRRTARALSVAAVAGAVLGTAASAAAAEPAAEVSPSTVSPGGSVTVSVSCDPVGGPAPATIDATSQAFEEGTVQLKPVSGNDEKAAGHSYSGSARIPPAENFEGDPDAVGSESEWTVDGTCPAAHGGEGKPWSATFTVARDSTDGLEGGKDGGTDSTDGMEGGKDGGHDSTGGLEGGKDGGTDSTDGGRGGTDATDGGSGGTDGIDGGRGGTDGGEGTTDVGGRHCTEPHSSKTESDKSEPHSDKSDPYSDKTEPGWGETEHHSDTSESHSEDCGSAVIEHGVRAGAGGAFTDSVPALVAGGLLIAGAFGGAVYRLRRRTPGEEG